MPESSSSFNFKRVVGLPEGVPADRATSAVRQLIERHQSLRARFFDGKPPQQRVAMSGHYEVEWLSAPAGDVAEVARSAVERLASTAFDLENEWAARIIFIEAEGLVRSIGLATSHVATDFFAMELLVAEFRMLLGGTNVPSQPAWQPLAQAETEASPVGLRRNQRSLQHWRKHLSHAPERVFATEPGGGEPKPFQTWALTSRAVARSARIIAERTRTSTSTVLLTATALLLRALSRRDRVVLKVISGNRVSPEERSLVAPNCNDGIFVCDPAAEDLCGVVAALHPHATASYMNARYDPEALTALIQELALERGTKLDLSAYFNDARLGGDWRTVPSNAVTRTDLERMSAESKVTLSSSLPEHDMTFCLTVFSQDNELAIVTLLADTRWLSTEACQRSLLGFEKLLCEAALRSVKLGEIAALVSAAN